jgi:transcriptional regulator with XRE-family HTH domain/tetratricopeptide (TPR) repeat protein
LAETLRRLRTQAGLTQEDLAERSGLSVRSISDIERGRSTRPHRDSLIRLATALAVPADQLVTAGPERAVPHVPHQLPVVSARLYGRDRELSALDRWLAAGTGPRVAALVGPGGAGKTTLAVAWAYQVRDRFPGGELYVNLRGFDGEGEPVPPTAALDVMLRSLGMPPGLIPDDVAARAGLFRSLAEQRRILVVLDNARDAAQVRPLLAGPFCLTIVTSRNQLRGLVVRESAYRVAVGPIGAGAAVALFHDAAGGIDERSAQFRELVGHCGGLPLALCIVAERVARSDGVLTRLAEQMRERATRLDIMNAEDDDRSSMRAILSWSYDALATDAARAFGLLGAFPGIDIGVPAAAILFGTTAHDAARLLDGLTALHLVECPQPGRFALHDVVRAFAGERGSPDDAATGRVLEWYRASAAAARHVLLPLRESDRKPLQASGISVAEFADTDSAMGWFDIEYLSLISAVSYSAAHGMDEYAADLTWLLWYFFDYHKLWDQWLHTHGIAVAAARRLGSPERIFRALNGIGGVYTEKGYSDEALTYFLEALEITQQIRDESVEAYVVHNIAITYHNAGDDERALEYARRRLELADDSRTADVVTSLRNLAGILSSLNRHDEALEYLHAARGIVADIPGDRHNAGVSYEFGVATAGLGRHDEALEHFQQALDIYRRLDLRSGAAFTLWQIGDSRNAKHEPAAARAAWTQSAAIFTELGAPEADTVRARLEPTA